MPDFSPDKLPIAQHFKDVERFLPTSHLVIEAPPGAGKSTALPLFLLRSGFADQGMIVMLQPRRLAALNIAHFLAQSLGEKVGEQVGYHIRQDRKVSARTKLLIVTEGIFTRMLQNDPELTGISMVIFDEFHERNLHSDLALAFCLETLELRDDLRLLVMSATLPGERLSNWLDSRGLENRLLVASGRQYPIQDYYRSPPQLGQWLDFLPKVVHEAVQLAEHGVLVFLPGIREIKRVQVKLQHEPTIELHTLYGGLKLSEQALALAPTKAGRIKVVLSTNIAETSLTIEGIDVVVDSGRVRVAKYDPQYRLTRLVTEMVSKASADQRRGRAGRLMPGVCFRLWPESQHERLNAFDVPAIETEDLSSLVLECAAWGVSPTQLSWFSPPSPVLLMVAYELLATLKLTTQSIHTERATLTELGEWAQKQAVHPRMGACLWHAKGNFQNFATIAWFIAVTEMREYRSRHLDMLTSLESAWRERKRLPHTVKRYQNILATEYGSAQHDSPSWHEQQFWEHALLRGFPDRVAQCQSERALLATGMAAVSLEPLANGLGIAVDLSFSDTQINAVVQQWLPISVGCLYESQMGLLRVQEEARWRSNSGGLANEEVTYWGKLELARKPSKEPVNAESRAFAFAFLMKQQGWGVTGYDTTTEKFIARLSFAERVLTEEAREGVLPCSADELLMQVEAWALPWLQPMKTRNELSKWKPETALWERLSYAEQQQVERVAPTKWRAPSGLQHEIDYRDQAGPKVALKLQEVFGLPVSPQLPNGQGIVLELLSPAQRPLHRTADLASFWQNAWPSVKKEMRGKYPKHPWPDDPIRAVASHLTKRAQLRTDN